MGMLSTDLVPEALIEPAVSGKLAADADPNCGNALSAAVPMDPLHQRPADTASLKRGIDGDAADVDMVRTSLKSQARNGSAVHASQEATIPSEILQDIGLGLAERAAGRIEPAVPAECQAGQAVDFRCRLGAALPDLEIVHSRRTTQIARSRLPPAAFQSRRLGRASD
jgi:hypothetical protein